MKLTAKEWASEVGGAFDDVEHYLNADPPDLELARKRVKDGIKDLHALIDALEELGRGSGS